MLLNGVWYDVKHTKTIDKHTIKCYDITESALDAVEKKIEAHASYGKDDKLLNKVIKEYPYNTDPSVVAMKIALIDVTNSTHLSQHKSMVSVSMLAEKIVGLSFDVRVKGYDPELVNDIAGAIDGINLFSFASKYCHLHNRHLYKGDDYPKYDGIVAKALPAYYEFRGIKSKPKVTHNYIEALRKNQDYNTFKEVITRLLDDLGLSLTCGKYTKLDHFLWFTNRKAKE